LVSQGFLRFKKEKICIPEWQKGSKGAEGSKGSKGGGGRLAAPV
jgi:hypothetical protein